MNKKILSVLALSTLMATLTTGCFNKKPETSSEAPATSQKTDARVSLKMSVNYTATNTGMKYDQDKDYTTPKGTVIKSGDWKPVYSELQSRLNFNIEDVTVANTKAVDDFKANKFKNGAELACANVSDIVDFSVKGDSESLLDIKEYLKIGGKKAKVILCYFFEKLDH